MAAVTLLAVYEGARSRACPESIAAATLFAGVATCQSWGLLALQLFGIVIGAIVGAISTKAHPIHIDAGFSITGWLAVLLTFVLARIFAEGTLMREDLQGTI